MAKIADWLKVDGTNVADSLHAAAGNLNTADGEMVLDFSAVERVDAKAVTALEQLVAKAKENSVRLVLRGVNVAVYKVFKLSRLDGEVGFLNWTGN